MNNFAMITDEEMLNICGGVDWGAVANAAAAIAIVSSAIPGGQGVTIVCGCFATGYFIGQAIKG